jgi:TonB family protein
MPEVLNSVAAEIKTITDTNKENRSATPVDDKNTESSPAPGTAKDTELELASVGASDVSEMRSDTSTVFSIAKVDVMPAYPGGIGEFYKWVGQNYKYPKTAVEAGVRGRVIVQFVVERDGSLTDIKTVGRPLGYGTAEEAIRLLQTSKKWKPGVQTGRPVRVQYTLPINLELPQTEQRKDRTVTTSETPIRLSPTYPGGLDAFYTWFGKNFKLPKAAKEARFAGTLILTFTVENDGSLTNIKILKDLKGGEYGVGEEAKRVLALSQKWKPAIQNGKPVRMQYSLPIMISNPTSENNTRPPGAGKPLVIIDGKTFEKEIPAGFEFGTADDKTFAAVFGFKQADITSITVLKDKKETSKYGEKGKNGVLIIKTRAKK